MPIVATADTLGGKPRIEGTRVSVLQVTELVLDAGETPAAVADQFDISLADVHYALAYYYEHVDEMERLERRREDFFEELGADSKAPDTVEQ
jgi:uncharacterized protein (DUF433 family)